MTDAHGRIVLVNAETERLFGYSREELIGRPIDALMSAAPRDGRPRQSAAFAAQPKTHRAGAGLAFKARRKDGSEFPVEVNLNSIESRDGLLVMSVIVDVTERRKAEEALALESEERRRLAEVLNNTIASMGDPVLVADAQGKILISNPPARKLFGEMVGVDSDEYERAYDRYYPDGVTPFPFERTPLVRAVRGETVDDLEYIVRPAGAAHGIHLVASGRPLRDAAGALQGAVTVYRDITRSKETEQAIRESEQLARGIIANSHDAIVQTNERGEVIEWNPQAVAIFGWSREEAIGRSITELYLPKGYRPRYLDMNERLREADGTIGERFEFEAVRKDGQKFKLEVSMTGMRRRDGNVYNLFLRDVTARIAAEEQLRQAQKMEAVGQLTGGIAHDFNNMLTVITGTIDLLADAVAGKPELVAIARLISEAADRGAELTGHLLAFARKQPLQPREIDINALMVDSARLLRPALGERVEIESSFEENLWPALVDPTQLTTALLNLAVNARDAMPSGGKLTLETRNVVLDASYAETNADVEPGNYVLVAVSDTGTGIPQAIRDKVFEPFFSTKEVGKGTGLGLSMVYGFVKQSGGHIKIYSEEGHGTTIRIYLPQAGAQAQAAAQPAPEIEGGSETILVVEDNPLVRNSVITQLASLGYKTLSAADGGDALALVDGGAAFDLLFTDVIMAGAMNGRELAEAVAARRPQVKVLFTSGYTENAILHHGRLDPGVFLLAKPYRKGDLARMVRTALAGAAGVPKAPDARHVQAG
jgi:PAS domain S-box-containing protein